MQQDYCILAISFSITRDITKKSLNSCYNLDLEERKSETNDFSLSHNLYMVSAYQLVSIAYQSCIHFNKK